MKKIIIGVFLLLVVFGFTFVLFRNLTSKAYEPIESNVVYFQDSKGNPITINEGQSINTVSLKGEVKGRILPLNSTLNWKYAHFDVWIGSSSDPITIRIVEDREGLDRVGYENKNVTKSFRVGINLSNDYPVYMEVYNDIDYEWKWFKKVPTENKNDARITWWQTNY